MRVMILADMEGVCGIQSWEHVGGSTPRYEEGRRLYTEEINAAVRGCKKGGATEIVVVDGHGGSYEGGKGFMSWIPDRLERDAEYVMGHVYGRYVGPYERGECDAVLFVGAHAMAGTPDGVLCHTISGETWHQASINGRPVNESGMMAAIAGSFGVPAVFASGDEAACRETQEIIGPEIVTAPVKVGLGRYAARNLAPADACRLIEDRIMHTLSDRARWPKPLAFDPPVVFEVELSTPDRTAAFAGRAGVEVVGPRTVRATGDNFWQAWDRFWHR
jgi:D-amino peptidase